MSVLVVCAWPLLAVASGSMNQKGLLVEGRWDQLNCSSILGIWELVLALEAGNSRVYERHGEVETQNSGEGSCRGCALGSSQYRQVLFEEPVVM